MAQVHLCLTPLMRILETGAGPKLKQQDGWMRVGCRDSFEEVEVVASPCSASSFQGPRTAARDFWRWTESCQKVLQSREHDAPDPSGRPKPSCTRRCARTLVFPVTSDRDGVGLEAAAGEKKDGGDHTDQATEVRSDDVEGSSVGRLEVHVRTSASQGPRLQWRCSCCTGSAAPPCSQAPPS